MNRDEAKRLLDRVLAKAGSSRVEATLGGGESHLTRFANNEITQNVAESRHVVSVRVADGKRSGRATGNDLSDEGISRLLARASEAARVAPASEGALPLLGPQRYRDVDAVDAGTAALGPEARSREVGRAVARTAAAGLDGAGIYETGRGTIGDYGELGVLAMANTSGLFAYHDETSATFSITALRGTESGWAQADSHAASDIDGDALASRAVEKALRARAPKSWEPGAYDVVLEPAAVSDLLQEMSYLSFGALAVQEGRSFLTGAMGKAVLGEAITLRDDPYHPLHRGSPFDAEGVPTQPVTLVERGVARSAVYDRMTAAKEGRESTGHGLAYPNTFGPLVRHLVLEGGTETLEGLVAGVERGLLVTRVWYTNVIEARSVTVTGMTRDGLFAIERGKVSHAVRNFRFNQGIVEMLQRVDGMTASVRAGATVCPALRVRGFRMSSGTEF